MSSYSGSSKGLAFTSNGCYAFLQGDLHEDIYMTIPQGFDKKRGQFACKLFKSLYGLKQASRQWNSKFSQALLQIGFTQSLYDTSLFVKSHGSLITMLLVYVDDIVITGNDEAAIGTLKTHLHATFDIKDLGPPKFFLGIEVARSKSGICLNQRK